MAGFLDLIRETKNSVKIPMIASVHCISPGTWTEFIIQLQKSGAHAIELNVNVLSSDTRLFGIEMENSNFTLAETLRKVATIPVALQIGYHFSSMATCGSRTSAARCVSRRISSPRPTSAGNSCAIWSVSSRFPAVQPAVFVMPLLT